VLLFYLFFTVLGLIIGSFLNVCIFRIPKGESVVYPGSHCPNCQAPIHAWQNLPLLSYLILRGKCRSCGQGISWVYPLVEAVTGLGFFLVFWKYGLSAQFFVNVVFLSLIIVLIFIDLFERLLPNILTLGGLGFGLLVSPLQSPEFFPGSSVATGPLIWQQYLDSLLGILVGGGFLWGVAELYLRVKKVEGMGFGDIKMMAMVGAFLGWRFAWLTILIGSLLGAVIGSAFILLRGKGRGYELPFGTFLGVGAIISLLWGKQILDFYLLLF